MIRPAKDTREFRREISAGPLSRKMVGKSKKKKKKKELFTTRNIIVGIRNIAGGVETGENKLSVLLVRYKYCGRSLY